MHILLGDGSEGCARRRGHRTVAVVVVEGERGDGVFHLGEGIEVVLGIVLQYLGAVDIIEQLIGVGNAAAALQYTYFRELCQHSFHLGIFAKGENAGW